MVEFAKLGAVGWPVVDGLVLMAGQ